jgi:prepilin-type N-terminal cleavage/methylation domain-containing protein
MRGNQQRRSAGAGFTLLEVMISVTLLSVLLSGVLFGVIALIKALVPPRVQLNGEVLAVAPSYAPFPLAVRLHQTLTDRVGQARAVYVLGGRHLSLPATAPAASLRPLAVAALPSITDFTPGLPLDAKSFYDLYATQLGPVDGAASADDFTVIVVGPDNGALALTCMVQVKKTDVTLSDGTDSTQFVVRQVRLSELGQPEQSYAFAERPSQTAGIFVGAMHTWLRYQQNRAAEEGPTCVVFPDPWVYGGARGLADDIPPFSRFAYFFAVSP